MNVFYQSVVKSENSFFSMKPQLSFSKTSYLILSTFLVTILLIGYIWWPLGQEYLSYINWKGAWWFDLDWLLIGIFFCMSILIALGANLKRDLVIIIIGIFGGLAIESWGTQTSLWTYYTYERPPLWIIPAWPIASLSIDRIFRFLNQFVPDHRYRLYKYSFWPIMVIFGLLMLVFIWPTIDKPLSILSTTLVLLIIGTTKSFRISLLHFISGSGLGFFLELWGTTRQCWTYYTGETPPLFAVLAHGMAAVIFWRVYDFINHHSSEKRSLSVIE